LVGILGLLTSWALMAPAAVLLFLQLGGPYQNWMAPLLGIAASLPLLIALTLGGFAMMFLSVRRMSRGDA